MTATLAAAAPVRTIPATWTIDPADSVVKFAVKNCLVRTVRGRFGAFEGTLGFDEADPAAATVAAAILTDSVDTGQAQRDRHLRSDDFLGVERCPRMTFVSTRVEPGDGIFMKVHGVLTIGAVTRAVTLDTTYAGQRSRPDGRRRVCFRAQTTISRKEFGMRWNALGGFVAGDRVEIRLQITAVRENEAIRTEQPRAMSTEATPPVMDRIAYRRAASQDGAAMGSNEIWWNYALAYRVSAWPNYALGLLTL